MGLKKRAWLETVEFFFVVLIWPALLAGPVLWALSRWQTWEVVAWFAGAIGGLFCYIRIRDRERRAGHG